MKIRNHAFVPSDVATAITVWVEEGRPTQPGIPWPRDNWVSTFPGHRTLFESLPDVLARSDVRSAAEAASADAESATTAFLASMAWGYGRVGYGPYRVDMILRQPDARVHLHRSAELTLREGAAAGYAYLATEGRLRGLGPAFATKYLHFIPQCPDVVPALIHDQIVSESIVKRAGLTFPPLKWNATTYQTYIETLAGWASALGVEPTDVEECLFRADATGQWGS